MHEYTIVMALEDFVPVILAAVGLSYITRMIAGIDPDLGRMAAIGTVLITVGGATKAIWKLIIAATGTDLGWLNSSLFIFLAPGFTLIAYALWSAQRRQRGQTTDRNLWAVPAILIGGMFILAGIAAAANAGRGWFFVLLTFTTVANLTLAVLLIRQSWQQGLRLVSLLFLFNIIAVFVLSGMARMEQTVAQQWLEQGLQTMSQLAFATAAWQLAKESRRAPAGMLATD